MRKMRPNRLHVNLQLLLAVLLTVSVPSVYGVGDWSVEDGVRAADGSVPFATTLSDGKVRLYYCDRGGIVSALSSDGLAFTREAGFRIEGTGRMGDPESIVCDPSLVRLEDGRFRLYYKGADRLGGPGQATHRIFSAISQDGLVFQKEGVRIDPTGTVDNGWASVPEIVKTFQGRFRLYYVSGAAPPNDGIASAISNDGLTFTREPGTRVKGVDPAVLLLPNGTYWLFFKGPLNLPKGIYSAKSRDGITFTQDAGVRVSPTDSQGASDVYDPTVVLLPDGTVRMYYGAATSSGVITLSARFVSSVPIPESLDTIPYAMIAITLIVSFVISKRLRTIRTRKI